MNMTTTTDTDPRVAQLVTLLKGVGGPGIADILKVLAPEAPAPVGPPFAPAAPVVTEDETVAVRVLADVLGKVVPDAPRALAPVEVELLMRERLALDAIENLAKKRKAAIRTIVFTHLDVEAGQTGERDGAGHLLVAGEAVAPALGKKFTREIAEAGRELSVERLEALVAEGALTANDFNALTRSVRVVDEAKLLVFLRKRPDAAPVLAQAVTIGSRIAKLCVRPFKRG